MKNILKIVGSIGCLILILPCLVALPLAFYSNWKDAQDALVLLDESRPEIRDRLQELQTWVDENGLNDSREPFKRIEKEDAIFVDIKGFERYFLVLDGKAEFTYFDERVMNPFDDAIKTVISQKEISELEYEELDEVVGTLSQVLNCKYAVLYQIEMKMPSFSSDDVFDGGVAVYWFTVIELETMKVVGSFDGVAENSDEISFYSNYRNARERAPKSDLVDNIKTAVDKELEENFWVQHAPVPESEE